MLMTLKTIWSGLTLSHVGPVRTACLIRLKVVPSVVVPLIWVRGVAWARILRLVLVTDVRMLLALLLELLPTIRTTPCAVVMSCRCLMSLVTAIFLPRVGITNIYRQLVLSFVGCLCRICRQCLLAMNSIIA